MLEMIIFLTIVILDQVTKRLAIMYLRPVGTFEMLPDILHLTYTENTGAAFSILAGNRVFLTVVPIIVCGIIAYALFSKRIKNKPERLAFVFVIGGAVGNVIDRIMYGAVVDFFEIKLFEFAIFNVADIFVCVGAALLVIYYVFFEGKKGKKI